MRKATGSWFRLQAVLATQTALSRNYEPVYTGLADH
jgi:hypothetical protein